MEGSWEFLLTKIPVEKPKKDTSVGEGKESRDGQTVGRGGVGAGKKIRKRKEGWKEGQKTTSKGKSQIGRDWKVELD